MPNVDRAGQEVSAIVSYRAYVGGEGSSLGNYTSRKNKSFSKDTLYSWGKAKEAVSLPCVADKMQFLGDTGAKRKAM